jgi:metal transporter CNNM
MSFEEKNLSIVMQQSKNMKQRQYAMRVFSLIRNHHLLLVTLLLWNAAAFESLPIFLDKLVPSYVAIILSVTFILIFGEVLPQAICTGPKRLYIGAQ